MLELKSVKDYKWNDVFVHYLLALLVLTTHYVIIIMMRVIRAYNVYFTALLLTFPLFVFPVFPPTYSLLLQSRIM